MLAVAGGAWALFGRDTSKTAGTASIGPKVPTATAPPNPVGPRVPGTTANAVRPTATSVPTKAPVAASPSKAAATPSATPAPTKAPVARPSPTKAPVTAPKPVAKPPVTAPQQPGTVAKAAYTFKVARGDTLWELTKSTLAKTGRSTSNASVVSYVAKLYSANRTAIGSNPDLILVGSTITWPAGL
ncbi:MAG: hypothetical protein JWO22_3314 [Frankiales bacterium]|nr:hypothetical protein [Frankiales bacterium]